MATNTTGFASLSTFLVNNISEISYLLSTVLMVFAGDYIMEIFLLKRLKGMSFVSRTSVFLLYGLLALPAMTALGAFLLRDFALNPFKDKIIVVLLISFLIVGILLSIKYNLKMKFKVK